MEKKFNNDYDKVRDIDLWHDGCYIKVLVFDDLWQRFRTKNGIQ